jgi:hypothetical protein
MKTFNEWLAEKPGMVPKENFSFTLNPQYTNAEMQHFSVFKDGEYHGYILHNPRTDPRFMQSKNSKAIPDNVHASFNNFIKSKVV